MKMVRNLFVRLARDESGSEAIEYVLVLGLIVVATLAAMSAVGTNVAARWLNISSSGL